MRGERLITDRYHKLSHKGLADVDFPSEFIRCGFGSCQLTEHKVVLDKLHNKICSLYIV